MVNSEIQDRSESTTYSETKADYVTGRIYEELKGIYYRGLITSEEAVDMRTILLNLQRMEALDFFEIQFIIPNSEPWGLRYILDSIGGINIDDRSGNIDYYKLPENTFVNFLVKLVKNEEKAQKGEEYLTKLGWGDGESLNNEGNYLKSFSKEGYGFAQNKIGW
jgi:Bacterial HORMA domain family 1